MRRTALLVVAVSALSAVLSWEVTDRLEQDNDFCVDCHLDPDTPLHQQKHSEFAGTPARNLAAAHYAADGEFRCIDCHGGASFANKFRVKAVAARDAAKWAVRWFGEPERMKHPLWDEDCAQCHASYESRRDDDFHAQADHNLVDFEYRCVECHRSHPTRGVSPQFDFLSRDVVLPVCRNCHEEF